MLYILTDEAVARGGDELRSTRTLLRDIAVEVLDSFAEPHAKDEERRDAYEKTLLTYVHGDNSTGSAYR